MTPVIINGIILILEIICFVITLPQFKLKALKFYTMLSNLFALAASALFLMLGGDLYAVIISRYTVTCMLVLTCIVAIAVLIPMGVGLKGILWQDCGLIFHLVAPVLSLLSYVMFEKKVTMISVIVPPIVTLIYGITILVLIIMEKITPPYPFLRVHEQKASVTVMWIIIVLGMITLISFLMAVSFA